MNMMRGDICIGEYIYTW